MIQQEIDRIERLEKRAKQRYLNHVDWESVINTLSSDKKFDYYFLTTKQNIELFFEDIDKIGSSVFDCSRVWDGERLAETEDGSLQTELFEELQEEYNCQILTHSVDMGSFVVLHNDFIINDNGNTNKKTDYKFHLDTNRKIYVIFNNELKYLYTLQNKEEFQKFIDFDEDLTNKIYEHFVMDEE